MTLPDPTPQFRHIGVHRHKLPDRHVAREHKHLHLHDQGDKFIHDDAPFDIHVHEHDEANRHDGKLIQIDTRALADALAAKAASYRELADASAGESLTLAKSYRALADRLDPPEEAEANLVMHDAAYYRELAEQTAGESLSLSKSYRQMAERRELAGDRHQSRAATNSITKSARRR